MTGHIDGGDPAGATRGKLNPAINNAGATAKGSPSVADNDDVWDMDRNVITTGEDGVCNTLIDTFSDDGVRIQIGCGEPYIDFLMPGPNRTINTLRLGDDICYLDSLTSDVNPSGDNLSPNEHGPVVVNVAHHANTELGGEDFTDGNTNINITTNDPAYPDLVRETMGHEGSHGCHLSHYIQCRGTIQTVSNFVDQNGNPLVDLFGNPITVPSTDVFVPDTTADYIQMENISYFIVGNQQAYFKDAANVLHKTFKNLNPLTIKKHAGHTIMMTNSVINPVPHLFDEIDLDQFRLHLWHE